MRLLATDYDGTLNHGGIGEEKLAAIRRWRAAGHKFGVISGRGPDFLPELANNLKGELDFLVSCNGGYATDGEGNLLYCANCDTMDVRAFTRELLDYGGKLVYINYGNTCLPVADPGCKEHYDLHWEEMPDIPSFYKMATFFDTPEEAGEVAAKLLSAYGEHINPLQNWCYVDIAPVGVNKAEGIRRLCALYGIAEEDVIAVGDNLNDEDMLRAYPSYAMAHGHPLMQEIATHVTADVTDLILAELEGSV